MDLNGHPVVRVVLWIWAVGGSFVAAFGVLIFTLFAAETFQNPAAVVAGVAFAVIGAVAAVLGVRWIRAARRFSRRGDDSTTTDDRARRAPT